MRIENDHAIIDTLAEWELFFKDDERFYDTSLGWLLNELKLGCLTISKQQAKEKLAVKVNDNYFDFYHGDIEKRPGLIPCYLLNLGDITNGVPYRIAANILTINKSIRELYDLGVWCNLWSTI